MVKVSVVIPCYNQGKFIEDALNSVLNQTFQDFEIIIVNDGSEDDFTNSFLENYKNEKVKIINTSHVGVGKVRNVGIEAAKGEYILPLDADDKIGARYLEFASEVLDKNSCIGIVYCHAEFFGEQEGQWELAEFNKHEILFRNCIFSAAMFRKSDWLAVGGYNADMIYGYEDWDFWLSILESGKQVYKIDETFFYYRKHSKSTMIHSLLNGDLKLNYSRIKLLCHHQNLYLENPEAARKLICGRDFYENSVKKYPKYKRLFNIVLLLFIIYFAITLVVFLIQS